MPAWRAKPLLKLLSGLIAALALYSLVCAMSLQQLILHVAGCCFGLGIEYLLLSSMSLQQLLLRFVAGWFNSSTCIEIADSQNSQNFL